MANKNIETASVVVGILELFTRTFAAYMLISINQIATTIVGLYFALTVVVYLVAVFRK